MTIKNLNQVVLEALDLHASYELPRLEFGPSKCRLVVASGNALPTGRIIFQGERCIFADEGQYAKALETEPAIDSVVVISASGTKHAPVIIEYLDPRKRPAYLLTCAGSSPAAGKLPNGRVFVTRSIPEPITYNTSTYMGMILARTREDPVKIKQHLLDRVKPTLRDFTEFAAFYLMIRSEFDLMREMFVTKFDELFGPRLLGRCYTEQQTFHAKTVVPWDKELFISFGLINRYFGKEKRRLEVPLPEEAGPAAMLATGYYVIGCIQKQFPPWFRKNAERYRRFQAQLPFDEKD